MIWKSQSFSNIPRIEGSVISQLCCIKLLTPDVNDIIQRGGNPLNILFRDKSFEKECNENKLLIKRAETLSEEDPATIG